MKESISVLKSIFQELHYIRRIMEFQNAMPKNFLDSDSQRKSGSSNFDAVLEARELLKTLSK